MRPFSNIFRINPISDLEHHSNYTVPLWGLRALSHLSRTRFDVLIKFFHLFFPCNENVLVTKLISEIKESNNIRSWAISRSNQTVREV